MRHLQILRRGQPAVGDWLNVVDDRVVIRDRLPAQPVPALIAFPQGPTLGGRDPLPRRRHRRNRRVGWQIRQAVRPQLIGERLSAGVVQQTRHRRQIIGTNIAAESGASHSTVVCTPRSVPGPRAPGGAPDIRGALSPDPFAHLPSILFQLRVRDPANNPSVRACLAGVHPCDTDRDSPLPVSHELVSASYDTWIATLIRHAIH